MESTLFTPQSVHISSLAQRIPFHLSLAVPKLAGRVNYGIAWVACTAATSQDKVLQQSDIYMQNNELPVI